MQESLFILGQKMAPQHLISRAAGRIANSRNPNIRDRFIRWFIERYGVDMSEAAEPDPLKYDSFNDFFTRALKPGARPFDSTPEALTCPADGAISQIGQIEQGRIFQAKGQEFTLSQLLGEPESDLHAFDQGHFATIYLSPRDYHRVHMPVTGTLEKMTFIPGQLFSVNPVTAERVPALFARNERVVAWFKTDVGPVAMVLVGAMIVASIATVWDGVVAPGGQQVQRSEYHGNEAITLEKGDEMGRFLLGSTVILITPKHTTRWQPQYRAGSQVRMGETLGAILPPV